MRELAIRRSFRPMSTIGYLWPRSLRFGQYRIKFANSSLAQRLTKLYRIWSPTAAAGAACCGRASFVVDLSQTFSRMSRSL